MKKVILLVIMGLVVAGGMKESAAMARCSGSNTGAGITGGSHGAMSGGPDCVSGPWVDQVEARCKDIKVTIDWLGPAKT